MARIYRNFSCVGELVANFSDSRPRIEEKLSAAVGAFLEERVTSQLQRMRDGEELKELNPEPHYSELVNAYEMLGDVRGALDTLCSLYSSTTANAGRSAVISFAKGWSVQGAGYGAFCTLFCPVTHCIFFSLPPLSPPLPSFLSILTL